MGDVAERYAERDSNTLKAAGELVAPAVEYACTANAACIAVKWYAQSEACCLVV